MTERQRAKLELERRKENRKLKAQGKTKLLTPDYEMARLTAKELRDMAGITSSS